MRNTIKDNKKALKNNNNMRKKSPLKQLGNEQGNQETQEKQLQHLMQH